MKKKVLALLTAATVALGATPLFVGCGDSLPTVKVWVSEVSGVKTLTESQIKDFEAANPDLAGKYKVIVEGVTEGEAATTMVTDVATGADVFCYAQDQMGRLIEAKAVSALGATSAKWVTDNNDKGSVDACTVNGKVYSYPLTSDNGYFMYYDNTVVKEEHLNDLAAIVKDCEDAGKNFSFELEGSAWYNSSFFFGAGCHSNWTYTPSDGKWQYDDNFGDETLGMIALKGMQILTNSKAYVNSSKCADFSATTPSAVVISGTWDAETAQEALGEKLGVTKLPSFTVDNKTYQLGSFSGFKLMGVKPQTDATRAEYCHKLAQYLTSEKCQMARLEQFSWGPSNKVAAASDLVKNNLALKGLAAQSPYSVPQGQIHGGWWDFAKQLGATKGADAAKLSSILKEYKENLAKYSALPEEVLSSYTVIGGIASLAGKTQAELKELGYEFVLPFEGGYTAWGPDLKMTPNEDQTVWKSPVVELSDKDSFKVRKGISWDIQYGDPNSGDKDGNFVVTAATAGKARIVLTLTKGADGKEVGTVTLEKAE